MSSLPDKALLPAGMQDGLPPEAAHEAKTAELLIAAFDGWGYARVKPPLMEFEENLLLGTGKAVAEQAFRVQDPQSQRMLALRPDMTLQVARIAASRLSNSPRPLRLAYSGQVARVQSSQLRPERQFGQVGVELIGASGPAADVEVVLMAAEALEAAGVKNLSIDLGLPTLCPAIIKDLDLNTDTQATLRTALDRKDAQGIKGLTDQLGADITATLVALIEATGPAVDAIAALDGIDLPHEAAGLRAHLKAVIEGITAARPDLALTLDPVESRGFEYHSGVTFSVFSRSVMGELGRGGRYQAGEPATGLTLFMDTVMKAVEPASQSDCVFLPFGTDAAAAKKLRNEGWRAKAGLENTNTAEQDARHLGCSHVLQNGTVNKLD
ncbi:MAG: ATP phosphoribosyltransferase regulatory subunit [Rhodospirillaceae bacterium]|nr:MAG: ATP phosphoribosyltransferase regulatory subunit [Rhodospirillaceae bacterium]